MGVTNGFLQGPVRGQIFTKHGKNIIIGTGKSLYAGKKLWTTLDVPLLIFFNGTEICKENLTLLLDSVKFLPKKVAEYAVIIAGEL